MKKLAAIIGLLWMCPGLAFAEEPAATPYRPTVSNPAELPVPGYLEFEAGWLRDTGKGKGEHHSTLPLFAKYAFSEDFGILLGSEFGIRQTDSAGEVSKGHGDTNLILKFRHPLADSSVLGLELGARFATATRGLGNERNDYTINAIYSSDFGPLRGDINLGYTRLGSSRPDQGKDMAVWAFALSRAINERWTVAGEISDTARHGMRASGLLLGAVSYSVAPNLVIDAAYAKAFTRTAPFDHIIMFGLTWLPR